MDSGGREDGWRMEEDGGRREKGWMEEEWDVLNEGTVWMVCRIVGGPSQ